MASGVFSDAHYFGSFVAVKGCRFLSVVNISHFQRTNSLICNVYEKKALGTCVYNGVHRSEDYLTSNKAAIVEAFLHHPWQEGANA